MPKGLAPLQPLAGSRRAGASLRWLSIATFTLSCTRVPSSSAPQAQRTLGFDLPRIDPPALRSLPAPEPQLQLWPPGLQGIRVAATNQGVQNLQVSLSTKPVASLSSKDVFDGVIAPILASLQFQGGANAFRLPPDGVAQPRANLKGVARLMQEQYGQHRAPPGNAPAVLDVFAGRSPATEALDIALRRVEGTPLDQFESAFQQLEFVYPFLQVVEGVPIEHTALVASRWDGQTVKSVSGTLLHYYVTVNRKPASDADPAALGFRALIGLHGLEDTKPVLRGEAPVLVLLPYGNAPNGSVALRYAWRMALEVMVAGLPAPFLAWVDAETSQMLKLQPLRASVEATVRTWQRDPGTAAVQRTLELDPAVASAYRLQLAGVSQRVDLKGDGNSLNDLQIAAPSTGSTGTDPDFDHPPLNDSNAACSGAVSSGFSQINLFEGLEANRMHAIYNGIFTPFPESPWTPAIDATLCGAWSTMYFGACNGYLSGQCPQHFVQGADDRENYLNFAHDGSIVAHEVAHDAVQRLTTRRPSNWCGSPSCNVPIGWSDLHDLADAWADHVEDTNCVGGWVAKNVGGPDYSRNCIGPDPDAPAEDRHSEEGELPRRHELDLELQPGHPRDHFPEHRKFTGEYADMQIATAALWQLREGMHSRYPVTGVILYFARLMRAIKATGMLSAKPDSSDLGFYTYLQDLEAQLMNQWASYGATGDPSANKVPAAFARAGLFLTPAVCIDGNAGTRDVKFCPNGEDGADAVIDIDDNDPSDDLMVDAVRHVESDFLRLGGPAPTFHVWTGTRFVFDPLGSARSARDSAPCNSRFLVEVSSDPAFSRATTVNSDWQSVDTDLKMVDGKECHGTWTLNPTQWQQLQASGAGSALYYRARTTDEAGNRPKLSTQPGNGLWNVPAPSARLTADGAPDL